MTPPTPGVAGNGLSSSAPAIGANATPRRPPQPQKPPNRAEIRETNIQEHEKITRHLQSLLQAAQIPADRAEKTLTDAATSVLNAIRYFLPQDPAVSGYIREIQQSLKEIKAAAIPRNPPANALWAAVAAGRPFAIGTAYPKLATQAPNSIVIQPVTEQAEALRGKSNEEGLRSGDIRVTLPSVADRDDYIRRRNALGSDLGANILRREFAIEALGLPLADLPIQRGRGADNSEVLKEVTKWAEKLVPGIEFTRIEWLRAENYHSQLANTVPDCEMGGGEETAAT